MFWQNKKNSDFSGLSVDSRYSWKTVLKQFPTDPVVVVISPLNSLIADQIGSCEKLGIKACKVDSESLDRLKEACKFEILYASPEIFDDLEARTLLQ